MLAQSALGVALADKPVLHDGPPEDAVSRVDALGAGPTWELDPLRPEQLVQTTRAGLVGVDSSCQRAPATAASLRQSVEFAEVMFERQKWSDALRHIAEAKAQLPCLVDEVDAVEAARLHLIEGIVAHEQDRLEDARVAFDLAQRFGTEPSTGEVLAWDGRLASPDRGATLLDAAGEALLNAPQGTLRFAPGVDPGRIDLRIDGRTVPLSPTEALPLAVGHHHIQVVSGGVEGRMVQTYTIRLTEDSPAVVADPRGLVGLSLAPHVNTPALADFIRAAGIQGQTWVVAGDEAWTYDTEWIRQRPIDLAAASRAADRSTRLRAAGIATMVTGAVVSGVGLWGLNTARQQPPWEETSDVETWRRSQHAAWVGTQAVGLAAIATGGVLVWTGRPGQ